MPKLTTAEYFKNLETKSGFMLNDKELSRVKEILLAMLADIIAYCDEHEIRYALGGGSVLGSIRHGGFIPWDDDIDIDIPREDYDRFLKGFAEEMGDRYWVRIPGKTEDHDLLLSQIRLKGTTLKTRDDVNTEGECGVPIDIFPVENTYDNALMRLMHGIGCMTYGYLVSCRKFYRDREFLREIMPSGTKKFPFSLKIAIGALISGKPLSFWVKAADCWNSRCADHKSRMISVPSGRKHFFGELCARSELLDYKKSRFEGLEANIPADHDRYLKRMYGDYMRIPPPEKREKHVYYPPIVL